MAWIGVIVTLLGFLISLMSLAATSVVGIRLAMVLAGIGMSIFGILGLINKAFLKNAIWKR